MTQMLELTHTLMQPLIHYYKNTPQYKLKHSWNDCINRNSEEISKGYRKEPKENFRTKNNLKIFTR